MSDFDLESGYSLSDPKHPNYQQGPINYLPKAERSTTDMSSFDLSKLDQFGASGNPDAQTEMFFIDHKTFLLPFVLADVNAIRNALAIGEGKLPALPPGLREDPKNCVLAKALSNGWNVEVGGKSCQFRWQGLASEMPDGASIRRTLMQLNFTVNQCVGDTWEPYVHGDQEPEPERGEVLVDIDCTWAMSKFVEWFDRGEFPDLVLGHEGPHSSEPEYDDYDSSTAY